MMGTPTYMSPEQCKGSGAVDARADIYSLGCIFYQLLTGRPPFAMEGAGEVIGMHLYVQPEPPSRVQLGISADTDALVLAMLAKDPGGRPQTARELAHALAGLAQAHGWATTSNARWSLDGPPSAPRAFEPTPDQPTTLSGAASQSVVAPRTSKRGLVIGLAAAVLVGGGLAAVTAFGGHGGTRAAAPIATPAPPAQPATPVEKPAVVEAKPAEPVPPVEQLAPPEPKLPVKKPGVAGKKKPSEKKPAKPDNGDLPIEHTVE
jgi:hypothetical protein